MDAIQHRTAMAQLGCESQILHHLTCTAVIQMDKRGSLDLCHQTEVRVRIAVLSSIY